MTTTEFELETGQMVGEYRVERKIGEGAFGKVYAAVHPVIGKPAAIKVLRPALSATEEMVERFKDEARVVNQIRHRHIIDIFAFGTLPNGLSYFVMELLEGIPFHKYLRTHSALDPALTLSILWPVARALSATHKAGVAHRDLKPENVFLIMDQDGGMFPKLLDFGIAKLQSDSDAAHRTRTGMILGTPVYMSPEQCRATHVDHRSDIYAFGIMLHEALTGSRPFDAENVMDVMMRQISDPPPKMSACRPGLPPALDAPVLHMLEKSAAKRPQTMQAALDELIEAARSCGIAVPSQGVGGPVSSGVVTPPLASAALQPSLAQSGPAAASAVQSAPHVDTGAWLQQQGARSSAVPASAPAPHGTLAIPSSSLAVPATSAAIPAASMAVAPASVPVASSSMAVAPAAAPAPSAETGTLLSAGVSPPGAHPSGPGAAPMSGPPSGSMYGPAAGPMSGPMYGPPSQAAPTPPKSNLPLLLGGGGAVLALLLGVVAFRGASGSGSGMPPSGSEVGTSAGAGSGGPPSSNAATVQLGSGAPRVGRSFEQQHSLTIKMGFTAPGLSKKLTMTLGEQKKLKVTVLAVDDWTATRVEVAYSESFESESDGASPPKKTIHPNANKAYFVSAQTGGAAVSAVDGKAVTEDEKENVIGDVGDLVKPRPELFRRPLAVGDTLSPPSAIAASLLGFTSVDEDDADRLENVTLRLASIDTARRAAVFDVRVKYIHDDKEEGDFYAAELQGSMTYDIDSSIALGGALSGPLTGKITQSGTKIPIDGSIDLDIKATIDR